MLDILIALALVVLVGALVLVLLPREVPGDGLAEEGADSEAVHQAAARAGLSPGWLALGVALATAVTLLLMDLPLTIAGAVALLFGIASHVALGSRAARRDLAFDLALAGALDLVVASLRSGAALVESLATASAEARGDAGEMLSELCDRVRLGERPSVVLESLSEQYPQEGARLFAFTLASHFDSGGSAATSLAEVARAIRDRVDVVRRASSQSVETQASVIGILAITYGLALMMWKQYPERVEGFTGNDLGRSFIGASILLQAVGLAWIARLTRVDV